MHISPVSAVRVVLEEHVIAALIEDWAVGVVHPVSGGEKMILRAEGIMGESSVKPELFGCEGGMGKSGGSGGNRGLSQKAATRERAHRK